MQYAEEKHPWQPWKREPCQEAATNWQQQHFIQSCTSLNTYRYGRTKLIYSY